MKAARDHYERIAKSESQAEMVDQVSKLSGRELHDVHHYALGREPGAVRDAMLICLLMEAGDRFMARKAAKAAKQSIRGKKLF